MAEIMEVRELKPRMNQANRLLGRLEGFLHWWGEVQDDQEQKSFEEVWVEFVQVHRYHPGDVELVKEVAQRFLKA